MGPESLQEMSQVRRWEERGLGRLDPYEGADSKQRPPTTRPAPAPLSVVGLGPWLLLGG